jgi:hypothetical protein
MGTDGICLTALFFHLVDSNDSLYGGDSKFLAENNRLCEAVMAQILGHLKTLGKDEVGAACPCLPLLWNLEFPGRLGTVHCGRETIPHEAHEFEASLASQ